MAMTAEQNYRLLLEIDANRSFILLAYQHTPALLEQAEARIKQLFVPMDVPSGEVPVVQVTRGLP